MFHSATTSFGVGVTFRGVLYRWRPTVPFGVIAAWILGLSVAAHPALAQDPVILPGIAGEALTAGELPERHSPYLSGQPLRDETAFDWTGEDGEPAGSRYYKYGVTGDWMGARSRLYDDGISLKTNVTQFYQGITTGGLSEGFTYGLKLDYFGVIEGEKLLGWEGAYLNLHGETRTGESIVLQEGSLLAANFATFFPKETGTASALTNLQFAQYLSEDVVVTFGKINTPDGVNIHPFMGGYGTDRFMNTGFVINPIMAVVLPYSTLGASISWLHELDPIVTLMVVDPEGQPGTSGLDNLFSNGVSLFAQLRIPVAPFGLPGHQTLDVAGSNGTFSCLSGDDYVIVPPSTVRVAEQTGTWTVNYGFDQLLVLDRNNPWRGWGVFGNFSVSDGNPNPIRWFMNLGIAGISPLPGRSADSFGMGYFYLGSSSVLKAALPIGDEHGCEVYYDIAVTRWFRLTADVQAIKPGQLAADSSLLAGLRAKLIF